MGNTALPRVGDSELQRLTTLIEQAINALEANPLSGLRILPPIAFPAFPPSLRVYHGLGRAPQGWWVVNASSFHQFADVTVFFPEPDPANYALLVCSVATTLTLAVF